MVHDDFLVGHADPILITGSNGFIGKSVVNTLLEYGFLNLRCFVRPSSNVEILNRIVSKYKDANLQFIKGNLLSRDDCLKATKEVSLILHLAAGVEKSFPGCFMNSVVTTRNLLDAVLQNANLKRFMNVSSIAVYTNRDTKSDRPLDETCEVDSKSFLRHEAYVYGKFKQDELLLHYANKYDIPYVIVRPGDVYGPGKRKISGRAGIDTFGFFLHLGGANPLPLTYVDNCAEAMVLAGIRKGVEGEVFNIMDDNPPTSKEFLELYKKKVKNFSSIYLPYRFFYLFCYFWEKYSKWSNGQLPAVFNTHRCVAHWKPTKFSNQKTHNILGWKPRVSRDEALERYFEYMRSA